MDSVEIPVLVIFPIVATAWAFVARDWPLRYAPLGFLLAGGSMVIVDLLQKGEFRASQWSLLVFTTLPFLLMVATSQNESLRRRPLSLLIACPLAYYAGVALSLAFAVSFGILTP